MHDHDGWHGNRAGSLSRRRWLKCGATMLTAAAVPAWARLATVRTVAFDHLHTGETVSSTYFRDGTYDEAALARIDRVLRDFRTGEVFPIRRELLDQLCLVREALGSDAPFQVISGYRSPTTNEMLRRTTTGVVSGSLHTAGMAIDVRLTDTRTRRLRDVAAGMRLGGVGYYAASDFVHLDVGRPRQW